jgi:hypothetical protein
MRASGSLEKSPIFIVDGFGSWMRDWKDESRLSTCPIASRVRVDWDVMFSSLD